jgi:hypothetical protein
LAWLGWVVGVDIWFQQYGRTRGVKADSSGFEHVFVGEIKGRGRG